MTEFDVVKSPSHYAGDGNVECMDAIRSMMHDTHFDGITHFWWGNAIKYLWRWPRKNGVEDLRKAIRCIEYMLDEIEGGDDEHMA